MKEDVNNTDELGRSKQQRYNKRRRGNEVDLLHSCNARVPPTKKREALDDKEQEEIRLGEIRSSFEGEFCHLNKQRLSLMRCCSNRCSCE